MKTRKELKNKPLVEAILEVRWKLPETTSEGFRSDPNYRLVLARLSEKVGKLYPAYKALSAASIPDELVAQVPQHQFRAKENGYPLVQLGPGIFTYNEGQDYKHESFIMTCKEAVAMFFQSIRDPGNFKLDSITLRYIDAILFDYKKDDAYSFLRETMRTSIELPKELFADGRIPHKPTVISLHSSYECTRPSGTLSFRIGSGTQKGQSALVWDTNLQSNGEEIPAMPEKFGEWLEQADEIIQDWFFELIKGKLEKTFSGE